MTVAELIEHLREMPQDSEVHFENEESFNYSTSVEGLYESTATYGIMLPEPRVVKTVVLTR